MKILILLVAVGFSPFKIEGNEVEIIREKVYWQVPNSSNLIIATIILGYTLDINEQKNSFRNPIFKLKPKKLFFFSLVVPLKVGRMWVSPIHSL
jgi:hypothetical protein